MYCGQYLKMEVKLFIFIFFLSFFQASAYIIEEECLNYTVYPVQYELTLIPYILSDERIYYDCDITITVIANSPGVRRIELDGKDFDIKRDSVKVLCEQNTNIINEIRPYEYDRKSGKIYLYLKQDLEPYSVRRAKYYIKISFTKFLTENDEGIFVVKYKEPGKQKYLLTTRLSPNKAKYFFPCIDNPLFEAIFKFKVYLVPYSPNIHYCNTSLVIAEEIRRHRLKDNYDLIEYMPSPQAGVHQAGFHYSDFISTKTSSRHTNDTFIIWSPQTTTSQYKYILSFGQSIMNLIHDYSGVHRPIVNGPMNFVSVPTDMDTYEVSSWNLMNIGDHKLAYSPQFTSVEQKESMSYDLSQQFCRIWLGNPGELRKTRWREEWFKEGMATFLGYYLLSESRNFHNMDTYGFKIRNLAMLADLSPNTPTLESFNRTLAINIPERYKQLVTMKTAALLWMAENWLGSEKFHNALVKYINTRRGKIISVQDFSDFLETETSECELFEGHKVSNVLNSWFGQAGYPVVKVTVYRNKGTQDVVYLEQKRYFLNSKSHDRYKYLIPISYTTQYTKDCYNCFQRKFTIDYTGYSFKENLHNGWIILNRNASGYYRVNYDDETWQMIIKTMKSQDRYKIDSLNRAQIIDDAFALYLSGDINFDLAINILSCLEVESDSIVWDAAINGFNMLKTDGAHLEMTKLLYKEWKSFMRNMVSGIYRKISYSSNNDDHTRLFRSKIINFACQIGFTPCLNDMESTLNQIRWNNMYDPDLRKTCYYSLLNESRGFEVFNKGLNRFEKDDLRNAEKTAKEEVRFYFNLPQGRPRPEHLMLSTTIKPYEETTKIIISSQHTSHSYTHIGSICLIFVALTIALR